MRVSGRRCAHACSAHAALECCLAPCQHHVPSRRQQAGAPAGSLADVPPPRLSPVPPAVRGGGAARPRLLRAVGGGAAGAAGGGRRPPGVQPLASHAIQRGICAAALTRLRSSGAPTPRCACVGRCRCPFGQTAYPACSHFLQDCMAVRHEAVQEAVPENAKNMLLVMASSGILTPDWKVGSLWGRGHRSVTHLSARIGSGAASRSGGKVGPVGSISNLAAGCKEAALHGICCWPRLGALPPQPPPADSFTHRPLLPLCPLSGCVGAQPVGSHLLPGALHLVRPEPRHAAGHAHAEQPRAAWPRSRDRPRSGRGGTPRRGWSSSSYGSSGSCCRWAGSRGRQWGGP
jgi:hypothetical protein